MEEQPFENRKCNECQKPASGEWNIRTSFIRQRVSNDYFIESAYYSKFDDGTMSWKLNDREMIERFNKCTVEELFNMVFCDECLETYINDGKIYHIQFPPTHKCYKCKDENSHLKNYTEYIERFTVLFQFKIPIYYRNWPHHRRSRTNIKYKFNSHDSKYLDDIYFDNLNLTNLPPENIFICKNCLFDKDKNECKIFFEQHIINFPLVLTDMISTYISPEFHIS